MTAVLPRRAAGSVGGERGRIQQKQERKQRGPFSAPLQIPQLVPGETGARATGTSSLPPLGSPRHGGRAGWPDPSPPGPALPTSGARTPKGHPTERCSPAQMFPLILPKLLGWGIAFPAASGLGGTLGSAATQAAAICEPGAGFPGLLGATECLGASGDQTDTRVRGDGV